MLTVNFNPFPELETQRLRLRKMLPSDAKAFFEMRSNKKVMEYIPRPLAQTEEDALKLIQSIDEGITKNELINWGIVLKEGNTLIGTIGYYRMNLASHRAEVGYLLHTGFQKKGYMQEALQAALKFGFDEMKLHSIEAVTDPDNVASRNLLQRNKFVQEAYFKENFLHEGKFLDSVHYGLLNKKI